MQVIKRNGKSESVLFDKITSRIRCLCYNLDTNIAKNNNLSGIFEDKELNYHKSNTIKISSTFEDTLNNINVIT